MRQVRFCLFYSMTIMLAGLASAWSEKPQRIVSMNLCTDQLLMLLADPEKIVSVSYLSSNKHNSYFAEQVAQKAYPLNHNLPEEILPLQPDLIVTGQFMHQQETRLLRKLGKRVETFPVFSSLQDVENNIRSMARLLEEPARGERLIRQMEKRLGILTARVPKRKIPALVYYPRGYTQGKDTIINELMELAGWHNVANDLNIRGYGRIGLEELVHARPRQLIFSEYAPGTRSLGQAYFHHPVLASVFSDSRPLVIDPRLLICGGPMNLEALEVLIQARIDFE